MPNNQLAEKLRAGEVYIAPAADHWTADIDIGEHHGKIQCYGKTEIEAASLRDQILTALSPSPAPGVETVELVAERLKMSASLCSSSGMLRITDAATDYEWHDIARAALSAIGTEGVKEREAIVREALQAIEDGEGDHQEIARQTLAQLGIATLASERGDHAGGGDG